MSKSNKRVYGRAIRDNSGKLVDFIETCDLQEAKEIAMGVDMNLDHGHFYSEACWIMSSTLKKLMKNGDPKVAESIA